MWSRATSIQIALLVVALATGCPGDGSELGMAGGGAIQPTLASIQTLVFTPRCASCHFPAGPGPMSLDTEDASYQNLVSVATACPPGGARVAPGDPSSSYLVQKIEGQVGVCGDRMPPPPQSLLTTEEIDAIRLWIMDGAPR